MGALPSVNLNILLSIGILIVGYLSWVRSTYRKKGDIEEEMVTRFEDRQFDVDNVSVLIEDVGVSVNNIYLRDREATFLEKLRDNLLPYGKFRGRTRFCMMIQDVPEGEKLSTANAIDKLPEWNIVQIRDKPRKDEDYHRLDLLFDTTDSETIRDHISEIEEVLERIYANDTHSSITTEEIESESDDSRVIEVDDPDEIPPEIELDKYFKQFRRRVGATRSHPESPLHVETHSKILRWVYVYAMFCILNTEYKTDVFEVIWGQRESSVDYNTSEQYIYEAGAFYVIIDHIKNLDEEDSDGITSEKSQKIIDTINNSEFDLPPPLRLLYNHVIDNDSISERIDNYDEQISDNIEKLVANKVSIFELIDISESKYSVAVLRRAACVILYTYKIHKTSE